MMYLLFSFVVAAAFVQGGSPTPVNAKLGSTCDDKREKPLDVFFLVDGSSSIGKNHLNDTFKDPSEWPGQLRFIKQLVKHSLTVDGDRVGIWQFALNNDTMNNEKLGKLEFALGTPVDNIVANVQGMEQLMGGTPTKEGIETVINMFKQAPETSEERDRLLVIITDGNPTCRDDAVYSGCHDPCHDLEGNALTATTDMLDDEGIMTVVIGVNNDGAKLQCLVEEPEKNIVKISDFHSFDEYKDPTGDENLLCVNPKELELNCCRVSVSTPQLFNMYEKLCNKYSRIECIHRRGTILGSCDWGVTQDGDVIDGCGVTPKPTFKPTANPTGEPTFMPTAKPTFAPTAKPTLAPVSPTTSPTKKDICEPLDNCVVKGGVKVFGWTGVGGKKKASSACACAGACVNAGGSESKWHSKRKICKCWKSSTHIEMKTEPFDANKKHGGNAGGKTQCVKSGNSDAEITEEKTVEKTVTVTRAPTKGVPQIPPAPATPTKVTTTSKPTTYAEWEALCKAKKENFLKSTLTDFCTWDDEKCRLKCA